MLNSCIEVSDYNEPYSLCSPLLPSPQSTLGLTLAKPSGIPPPLNVVGEGNAAKDSVLVVEPRRAWDSYPEPRRSQLQSLDRVAPLTPETQQDMLFMD